MLFVLSCVYMSLFGYGKFSILNGEGLTDTLALVMEHHLE